MSHGELKGYAKTRIRVLKLGTTPTNCNGVEVYDHTPESIILCDGIGLNAVCRTREEIDTALVCLVEA